MSAVLDEPEQSQVSTTYTRPPLLTFHWRDHEGAEDVAVVLRAAVRAEGIVVIQCEECQRGVRIPSSGNIPKDLRALDALELGRVRSWARYWIGRRSLIIHPDELGAVMAAHFDGIPSTAMRRRGDVKEFL